MDTAPSRNYSYKLGGSLPLHAPSYVVRSADQEFYDGLKAGEFCYVFNSRQMGKSSLRVQTIHRLQADGIACGVIDITGIGIQEVTPQQWYASLLRSLVSSFRLDLNLRTWWRERDHLSCVQRLNEFVEEVLLVKVEQNIVIFIDEIDSVLGLSFPIDDFFAWIRASYDKRARQPAYRRLTFALLGVATPSNLIADKNRTPFNIGRAIQLNGFELHEAEPLAWGLVGRVDDPQQILASVLAWTGGQPFLTQKLCQLVVEEGEMGRWGNGKKISPPLFIEQLVQRRIIENWEAQDEPEHLKTLRDRLLRNEQRASRLLGLYQQILAPSPTKGKPEELPTDDSAEQTELLLSGLVAKQNATLRVRNRIYQEVFNASWVDKQLSKLRPYSEALRAWVASDCKDESRLLRGQALRDALAWSAARSLSDLDYQFLAKSQELDKREVQISLQATQRANQILEQAQQKAKRMIRRGLAGLVTLSLVAVILLGLAGFLFQRAVTLGIETQKEQILTFSKSSKVLSNSNQEFNALLDSLRAVIKLQRAPRQVKTDTRIQAEVVTALREAVYGVREKNRLEGHKEGVYGVSFSPDGQTLASASADNTIKLWSLDGRLLRTLEGHSKAVKSVSFSPNGQTLVSASEDGTVKLWSKDGTPLKTLSNSGAVYSVSFSPDSQTVASASADKTIKLWSLEGTLLKTLTGHGDEIYSVSFSPDGKTLASASADKTIKLWNQDGGLVRTLEGHKKAVKSVSFSPDGQMIVSASEDGTVKLWNQEGTLLKSLMDSRIVYSGPAYSASFSPDGQMIASVNGDATIKLWNRDGTLFQTFIGHSDGVYGVSFSPNGQMLASASSDKTVRLWSCKSQLVRTLPSHGSGVYGVSFSPDARTLASASDDKTIKLWRSDGTLLNTLTGHSGLIHGVSFSPDGKTLASASWDKTIKLWRSDGTLLNTLTGHSGGVYSVSFSPDGKTLASASNDKTIKLWSQNGHLLRTLTKHTDVVHSVKFSPDGQMLVSASHDKTLKLWRLDGKVTSSCVGHSNWVHDVSFSPDGQFIASASHDKTVKLWSKDGQLLKTLNGHTDKVLGVSFSPDSQLIASSGQDNTVKLWHLDGTLIATLKGHSAWVHGVSFSPDGKTLASASYDNTVILWNLHDIENLDALLGQGCDRVGDYLKTNPYVEESDRHLCDGI